MLVSCIKLHFLYTSFAIVNQECQVLMPEKDIDLIRSIYCLQFYKAHYLLRILENVEPITVGKFTIGLANPFLIGYFELCQVIVVFYVVQIP